MALSRWCIHSPVCQSLTFPSRFSDKKAVHCTTFILLAKRKLKYFLYSWLYQKWKKNESFMERSWYFKSKMVENMIPLKERITRTYLICEVTLCRKKYRFKKSLLNISPHYHLGEFFLVIPEHNTHNSWVTVDLIYFTWTSLLNQIIWNCVNL